MADIFHFKQFSIDQTNCAMKVNTDGALLAALSKGIDKPLSILDIGTGTGMIALMLAQKYISALVHAVEIDEQTLNTAKLNFEKSPYFNRISAFHSPIEEFWAKTQQKYDLIVSNPPFFINSLISKNPKKEAARHTDTLFYERLIFESAKKLKPSGYIYLILPVATATLVKNIASKQGLLYVKQEIMIHSFSHSKPHRSILVFSFENISPTIKDFVIYEKQGRYTLEYRTLLKDYLTIF